MQGKDIKLLQVFRRDAEKALVALREASADNDMSLFITTVHAMKSALANIGEDAASKLAASLENAGLNNDKEFIAANTEDFANTLEALLSENADDGVQEDITLLTEHLLKMKEACDDYNRKLVYASLSLLKEKKWKTDTIVALEEIREIISLHSDFGQAGEKTEELLKVKL